MAVQSVDFSAKHDVLIRNEDGSLSRMDEPYFLPRQIAPGTWQILGDGDFSYLVEGDEEALVIDAGYGCGNIRAFCQSLTKRPVRYVVNTHHHFDHTANNCYFERAYMSEETRRLLAGLNKPSLKDVDFPRDYPIEIVGEGYVFHLGGRDLTVFGIPDHAEGSIALLDSREHILFSGDEITMPGKRLKGSVERFAGYMQKLCAVRDSFDLFAGGGGIGPACYVERYLSNARYIMEGHEGREAQIMHKTPELAKGPGGETVYARHLPRPCDMMIAGNNTDMEYRRCMRYAGCEITYDLRKIFENSQKGGQ